jgi:hypothetical protein
MKIGSGKIVAWGLSCGVPFVYEAENCTETETHVMRGISERQNTLNRMSQLAVEKGSTQLIPDLAKIDQAERAKPNLVAYDLAQRIGIAGVGMGAPGPGRMPHRAQLRVQCYPLGAKTCRLWAPQDSCIRPQSLLGPPRYSAPA